MDLFAWGANSRSQLGQGIKNEQITTPQVITTYPGNISDITAIQGGGAHTLILNQQGNIFACGSNNKGQLGLGDCGDRLKFEQIVTNDDDLRFVQVVCGWETSVAISRAGDLYIFGTNPFASSIKCLTTPTKFIVPNNEKVRSVSMGFHHICILTTDNVLYFYGRLRNFKEFPLDERWTQIKWNSLDFFRFTSNDNVVHVCSGQHHFIISFRSGLVRSYGDNRFGQTSFTNSILDGNTKITSGWTHNGCLCQDGSVYLWGRNNYGQIGSCVDDSIVSSPTLLPMTETVKEFHLGSEHGLVVTVRGRVFTWGWNEHSNCGNGNTINVKSPVEIPLPGPAVLGGTGAGFCFVVVKKL